MEAAIKWILRGECIATLKMDVRPAGKGGVLVEIPLIRKRVHEPSQDVTRRGIVMELAIGRKKVIGR